MPHSPLSILVVEDDPLMRELIHTRLSQKGAAVTMADNGFQAVKLCLDDERGFDLILMDLMMPLMDGAEAAMMLKAHPRTKDTPILMVSAHHCMDPKSVHADFYLQKPFRHEELWRMIKRAAPRSVAALH